MGLTLYAGPLSRLYAEREGASAHGAGAPGFTDGSRAALASFQRLIDGWMARIAEDLGDAGLWWRETPDAPVHVVVPGWPAFAALLLWAAYDETPGAPRPDWVTAESWAEDQVLFAAQARAEASTAPHLLLNERLWLPTGVPAVFEAPSPSGQQVVIGSVDGLLADLDAINQRTWRADEATARAWAGAHISPSGGPFEALARTGWAVTREVAAFAARERMPIVAEG